MGAQLINAALDISALFEARKDVISRATRFTSKAQPGKILAAVEEPVVARLQGASACAAASAPSLLWCVVCPQPAAPDAPA